MMTRSLILLGAAWLLAAAADPRAAPAPIHHTRHARQARHMQRHVHKPDAPPVQAAKPLPAVAGTEPAPVPNEAVADVPPGQAPATHITPSLLQLHYPSVGDGYVQGSSPQAMDDRNTAKAPGVEVQVPLQQ